MYRANHTLEKSILLFNNKGYGTANATQYLLKSPEGILQPAEEIIAISLLNICTGGHKVF